VNSELDTLLAVLQRLDRDGHFDQQLRLARALSRLLAVALRWIDLLRSLRELLAGAERRHHERAKAWALHELGTLRLAAGDLVGADEDLTQASELRRELGERRELAATESNLRVLCRTLREMVRNRLLVEPSGLWRLLHASNLVVAAIFLFVFLGGTAAVAASGLLSARASAAAVTQISPSSGPKAGGTIVTITGTGLAHAKAVSFGKAKGTHLKDISDTHLQVDSPTGAGSVPVAVVMPAGNSAPTSAAYFTYFAVRGARTVDQVLPNHGPEAGGTIVTITGTGLAHAKAVSFGKAKGTHLADISDTQLQVDTPAGTGSVPVTVVTPSGKSAPSAVAHFTYTPGTAAPTIGGVSPSSGPQAGGTIVTITGTGLGSATAVAFGSANGTNVKDVSGTQLRVDAPAGTGTVALTVVTPAGRSGPSPAAHFRYLVSRGPRTVDQVLPGSGPQAGGTSVTITGTGLTGATEVTFGAKNGTNVKDISDTQLQVVTPAGAGTVPVSVITPSGSSAPSPLAQFTYTTSPAAPTISGISPTSGASAGGTIVTITGAGLASATAVTFGQMNGTNLTDISDTQLQVDAPAGTGTVPVTVLAPTGSSPPSAIAQFTYTGMAPPSAPTISTVGPPSGPQAGGTMVTITGNGLANATRVSFGQANGTNLIDISDSELEVDAPAGTGTVAVTVLAPAGSSPPSPNAEFTYIAKPPAPPPTISGISPAGGPQAGGTTVTVTGTGLASATSVSFGTTKGTNLKDISGTQLQVDAPAGTGTVPVTVVAPAGSSAPSSGAQFTYTPPSTTTSTPPTTTPSTTTTTGPLLT
jgi:hypothetical protein